MVRGTSRVGAVILVAAWFSAAACGGETTGATPIPLSEIPQRGSELTCRKLFECCTSAQIMSAGSGSIVLDSFTDVPGCQAAYQKLLEQAMPTLEEAVAQHRTTYDANAAGECFTTFESMSCAQLTSGTGPKCDYFTPHQGDGQACKADVECLSDSCDGSSSTLGVCVPRAKVGEPCSNGCEEGAYCDSGFACAARKPDGAECSLGSECVSTRCSNGICGPDSICPP